MFNLFLILMGLFSNPSSSNTSNCGGDNPEPVTQPSPTPSDTGGETIQTPRK